MENKAKKFWLCNYLERKLDLIEKDPAPFSNHEKHFMRALGILYKTHQNHANDYAEKYRTMINKKMDRVLYKAYKSLEHY